MNAISGIDAAIRNNTLVWFKKFGRIFGKDRKQGIITPVPNFLQRNIQKVIQAFEDRGLPIRIIGLKPRQRGSTTYFCAADYCHMRRHSTSAVIIGGEFSQTKEAWGMMQTYAQNDRFDWGNSGEINTKEGRWTNGSKLKPETARDELAGISGTYQVLHCTEVARWAKYGVANAPAVLSNILKCVPLLPDTMIILESTAEGASGAFYERWVGAVDAEEFLSGAVDLQPGQYVRVFAPWYEFDDSAMRLTPQQKRDIERTLDSEEEFKGEQELIDNYGRTENGVTRLGVSVTNYDVWEQLAWRRWAIREECEKDKSIFDRDYPHSWQTAFQRSGSLRFNQTGVSVLRKRLKNRTPEHGIIEETKEGRMAWKRADQHEGKVTIFEKPLVGGRYVLSIDPMTGASQVSGEDPDWHGVFVLRAGFWDNIGKWHRPSTAARIVPCRWDIDVLEEEVWRLARFYGGQSGCKIVVEINQDRGLIELLKTRGADLYVREIFNRREFKTTTALGYQTNPKTREILIDTLGKAIREWDTPGEGIDIYCPHAITQLENFIKKDNGRTEHAEGHHDDDVLSLALGLQIIEHATTYVPQNGMYLPPDLQALQPRGGPKPSAFS